MCVYVSDVFKDSVNYNKEGNSCHVHCCKVDKQMNCFYQSVLSPNIQINKINGIKTV